MTTTPPPKASDSALPNEPIEYPEATTEVAEESPDTLACRRALAQSNWLIAEYEELIVELAGGTWPSALSRKSRIIALLAQRGRPLPDDLHEQALRQGLLECPGEPTLTRSLISLLLNLGRLPMPSPEELPDATSAPGCGEAVDAAVAAHAAQGDTSSALAVLWQSARDLGHCRLVWSRFAAFLADRGDLDHAIVAFEQAISAPSDVASITLNTFGYAMTRLADAGRITPAQLLELGPDFENHECPEVRRHQASVLRIAGDQRVAAETIERLVRPRKNDAWTHLIAFRCHFSAGNLATAYEHFRTALALDPMQMVPEVIRNHGFAAATLVRAIRRGDELAEWLTALHPHTPGVNLIAPWPAPESRRSAERLRQQALERGLPSAFIVAQGKSGSVAITQLLAHGFALPNAAYAFTVHRVIGPWAKDVAIGGACQTTHLIPRDINVRLFAEAGVHRLFVHGRDPRGQVVSLVHHYTRYGTDIAETDARWHSMSFDERLDFCVSSFLPEQIDWLTGWLDAQAVLPVHFTTYEEFVGDKSGFIDRMVAAYGGNTAYFDRNAAIEQQEGIDYHFRSGQAEGWRKELTATQIARINAAIPDRLWTTFPWNP